MKKPTIYSEKPVFSQGDFDVFVGTLDEDKLPMYVVINRTTDVVEFTSEVTLAYKGFLDHVAPEPIPSTTQEQLTLALNS